MKQSQNDPSYHALFPLQRKKHLQSTTSLFLREDVSFHVFFGLIDGKRSLVPATVMTSS